MELEDDEKFMAEAIKIAEKARFRSSPNPWVGAVVVANRQVVGKGCTEPFDVIELEGNSKDAKLPDAGSGSRAGIHAEIKALSEAGELANGGTLYTTLEPCNHHGRTGPCTDAIIKSGVKRVVVAIIDPDEKVSGTGIEALRSADINVDVGAGSFEANRQLAPISITAPRVVLM